jgi:uncharacterized protein (DUF433 family)
VKLLADVNVLALVVARLRAAGARHFSAPNAPRDPQFSVSGGVEVMLFGESQPHRGGRSPSAPFDANLRCIVTWQDRITITPEVRSGKACVRGTRITVYDVLEYLAGGMSEDELLRDFPALTREDVRAVLAFAATRERRWSQPPAA